MYNFRIATEGWHIRVPFGTPLGRAYAADTNMWRTECAPKARARKERAAQREVTLPLNYRCVFAYFDTLYKAL